MSDDDKQEKRFDHYDLVDWDAEVGRGVEILGVVIAVGLTVAAILVVAWVL